MNDMLRSVFRPSQNILSYTSLPLQNLRHAHFLRHDHSYHHMTKKSSSFLAMNIQMRYVVLLRTVALPKYRLNPYLRPWLQLQHSVLRLISHWMAMNSRPRYKGAPHKFIICSFLHTKVLFFCTTTMVGKYVF